MHYYLKKIGFFSSRTWPQKLEIGCGRLIKKMKSAASFAYDREGTWGLVWTGLEIRKGYE
jgi:hypothetical protein